MPPFDATTTSGQVVEAFASQVRGRTFVITGAGQPSIGSSMATLLARASPQQILIASRTAAKVTPVLAAINKTEPGVRADFVQVDLSDHESVRHASKEILDKTGGRIDGIELQLSANHVGHYLLTNLLVPALKAAADHDKERGARVVNLTSLGYRISPFRFDDYNFSGGKTYDLWTAYGQAKTANILFTLGLTTRLKAHGITSFAAHPGSNLDTKLGSHLGLDDYNSIFETTKRNTGQDFVFDEPRFKTYEQIGATPLAAALDPGLAAKAPAYLQNCQVEDVAEFAANSENVGKLWNLSEELVGEEFRY